MKDLILIGVVIGLLAIVTVPPIMTTAVNATIQPGQAYIIFDDATEHINQAQAALQNGDIEGANNHLELAKQSLQGNQSNQGQE